MSNKRTHLETAADLTAWASEVPETPAGDPAGATVAKEPPVALTGRLGRLNVPSLVQFLALIKKSGKLTITNRNNQALILFRNGQIAYAATNSVRETLGNMLVCESLISEETLLEALEEQHCGSRARRLGTILQEMGAVSAAEIRGLLELQTEKVIFEIAGWDDGFFKFEMLDLTATSDVSVDAQDFLLDEGVRPDAILYRVAGRVDERASESETQALPATDRKEPSQPLLPHGLAPDLLETQDEVRPPTFTAEVTVRLRQQAATIFGRVLLFLHRPGSFRGMTQHGIEHGERSAERAVRDLSLPDDAPSILTSVLECGRTIHGHLSGSVGDRVIQDILGTSDPGEATVVPMKVGEEIVLLLYGDSPRSGTGDEQIGELEGRMERIGLEIERSLLELRMQAVQTRLNETA